jgi:hypothetical protein
MALTPEQHAQIAAVYDKCAADHMVPPQHRQHFPKSGNVSHACSMFWYAGDDGAAAHSGSGVSGGAVPALEDHSGARGDRA